MKQLIIDTIEAISNVKGIRYVADDVGQADMEVQTPSTQPVIMPAALVGLSQAEAENRTKDDTRERVVIAIRLLDAPSVIANAKAPQQHQDGSLYIFDIRQEVIAVLNGVGLRYQSTTRTLRADGIRELLLLFTTHL